MAWVENEIFKTMYFLTLRYVTSYCLTLLHLSPDKEIVLQVGPTPLPSYPWMVLWSRLCRKSQRKRDGCLFFTHWHFLDLEEVLVPHHACVHLPSTHCRPDFCLCSGLADVAHSLRLPPCSSPTLFNVTAWPLSLAASSNCRNTLVQNL